MLVVAVRRLRSDAIALAVGLAVVGAIALATGSSLSHDYRNSGLASCLSLNSRAECQPLVDRFVDELGSLEVLIIPLVLLPALLGAFIGAPLVARELETGTYRFLWTQGVTRRRWLVASTVAAMVLALLAAVVFALIAARWLDVTNRVTDERFSRLYDFQGIIPIAASLLAVAIGIASGVLIRRSLPAMATTIVAFVAVRLGVATLIRPLLAPAKTLSVPFTRTDPLLGSGAWELSNRTIDSTGVVLGEGGSLDLAGLGGRCAGIPSAPDGQLPAPDLVDRCLHDLDVRLVIRYQPGDRFWTFQILESMLLVGIAAACIAIAFVVLDRRTT